MPGFMYIPRQQDQFLEMLYRLTPALVTQKIAFEQGKELITQKEEFQNQLAEKERANKLREMGATELTPEDIKHGVKPWATAGGKQFAAHFSRSFRIPMLVVDKRRNALTNKVEEITVLKPEDLSIEGKTVFIVDDMIDSGGSIVDVCMKYKELGAKEINIAVFYGLFSSPAEDILNKLREQNALNKLIVTDLVRHDDDFYKRNPFSVSPWR